MPYAYVAAKSDGRTVKGRSNLSTQEEVAAELARKGLIVVSIEESKGSGLGSWIAARALSFYIGTMSHIEKVLFTKHLSVMLRAGLTVTEALHVVEEQLGSKRIKEVAVRIREGIERGERLADAMAEFPSVFSLFYVNVVRAGEISGTLEENLDHLAAQFAKEHDLRKKVQSAMLYPGIVFVAALLIGFFFSTYVLPQVAGLFKQLKGVQLPFVTVVLLKVSDFTRRHTLLSFVGVFGSFAFIVWFLRRKFLAPVTHAILLRLPIIKDIVIDVNMARFALVFGTLMRSGIDIVHSLEVTATVMDNIYYRKAIERMVLKIQQGSSLVDGLLDARKIFPPVASSMISIGEESGKLEEVLNYLQQFYELEVDTIMSNLSTILEPVLLLFIGAIALVMAFAILIPIYNFISAIRRI